MSKAKKIILVLCSFITIFALVFSMPVSASSSQYVFNYPIAKPEVLDNTGYIEVLYTTDNGATVSSELLYISMDFFYDDIDNYTLPRIMVNVYSGYLEISAKAYRFEGDFSYFYCRPDGSIAFFNTGDNEFTVGYGKILGIHLYGDVFASTFYIDPNFVTANFVCNYGSDALAHSQLNTIISILQSSNQGVIDNANQNANQIQQNQNENTDKIIENQQQMQENEKNEAETQGQGSVDEIGSAIEDKSAGFISAIGSLVNSMSYNGTACAWSFPALKLPAIEGVMPEYQLTQEQPIDFEYWVNKIPSDILLLVRSLLTIALIVYCFKELYSTISYVLTLKGGGNNE